MPQLPRHSDDMPTEPATRAAKEPSDARDDSDADDRPIRDREPQPAEAVLADEAAIDEAIEMTFPASDPPAWTSSRGGHDPDARA